MSYLGVSSSATGRRWVGLDPEQERMAEAIAQTGQPLPLARHLARRGVAPADAASFLAPQLRDLLPDPLSLRDMGAAADRLLAAVARRPARIAIFADYDVDGGDLRRAAGLVAARPRADGHDLRSRPHRRRLRPQRPRHRRPRAATTI